jgi:hypothetical protein
MIRVPLFSFIPGVPSEFRQKSEEDYSNTRKHKDRPIKDRPDETPSPMEMSKILRSRIINIPVSRPSRDSNLRQALLKSFPFRILLEAGFKIKPFGYNWREGDFKLPVASRGTSEPNTVVATDALSSCIGVAVGGEKIKEDGEFLPGAKTRVFHIYNFNKQPLEAIYESICAMQEQGLTVKVGMTGGRGSELGHFHADELRAMFSATEVEVMFDRTDNSEYAQELRKSGMREEEIQAMLFTPIASVIHKDHRVQHALELAQLIHSSEDRGL